MKKHLILAAVAALATFTACSNEDENEQALQGIPVNFTVNAPTTRATTTLDESVYKTTFDANDRFGVYATGLRNEMDNAICKIESDQSVTPDNSYFFKDQSTNVTFNAYFPATGTTGMGTVAPSSSSVTYTIAADQSEGKYRGNDFMIAKTTGSGSSPNVALNFEHQLALVIVKLTDLNTANKVVMNQMLPTATYTFANGTVTTESGASRIDVTMDTQTAAQEYWALVPAQSITSGKELFTITTSDNLRYTYTTTGNLNVDKGKVYKITLKKSAASVSTALTATASQWGDVNTIIEEGETKEEYVSAVTASTEVTQLSRNRSELKTNSKSWGYLFLGIDTDVESCTATNNGWEIKRKSVNSLQNGWHNNTLYYFGGETKIATGLYKLTFKAKASNAVTIEVRLVSSYWDNTESKDKDLYFGTASTMSPSKWNAKTTFNLTTSEQECTVYINTTTYAVASANDVTATNSEQKEYYLAISMPLAANCEANTYTITNIRLVRE